MGFKPTRKGEEKGALGERVCYTAPPPVAHTHFPLTHTEQLGSITLSLRQGLLGVEECGGGSRFY